jgi:hypothetical protein
MRITSCTTEGNGSVHAATTLWKRRTSSQHVTIGSFTAAKGTF